MRSVKVSARSYSRKNKAQILRAAKPALESLETRRLLAFAGDPDLAFNGTGWNDEALSGFAFGTSVAVEPGSNSVYVAGQDFNTGQFAVVKFTSTGILDFGFDGDGIVQTPLFDSSIAQDVVVAGGQVYVTGTYSDSGDEGIFVLRLSTTGVLDTNFDGDGIALANDGITGQQGIEMLVDPDNSDIYVAGGSNGDATVVRLLADGSLDTDWGTGGFATNNLGGPSNVSGIAQQANGQIVISANIVSGYLARLDATGSLDTDYGIAGVVQPAVDTFSTIDQIVIDASDNVYAVGFSTINFVDLVGTLRKFDSTGTEVAAFDGDGEAVVDAGEAGVSVITSGLTLDGSGRVVVAGLIQDTNLGTVVAIAARFDQVTGALDVDFGDAGIASTIADGLAGASEVAIDDDGNVVIGGGSFDGILAARFLGEDDVVVSPVFVDLNGNLVVPGTAGNDTFVLTAVGSDVQVQYNGDDAGTFSFTGAILIDGGDGHDSITLDAAITDRAEVFGGLGDDTVVGGSGDDFLEGGDGNDNLSGGNGTDIILGGADNDVIAGQGGRDLLIGGLGSDNVSGGADSDLMIAATTDFDGSEASLDAILAVWDMSLPYVLRVVAVRILAFRPSNLNDDGAPDTLLGGASQDWFILDVSQDTSDRVAGELQTNV